MSDRPEQPKTEMLKLLALDREDLEIISAHCRDSVLRVGDIAFLAKDTRFVLLVNRFDWENALEHHQNDNQQQENEGAYRRRRAALRFEGVKHVRAKNLDQADRLKVFKLLAINFRETNPPGGEISLIFSGGSEIRLDVDYIETALKDLGAVWETTSKPAHKVFNDEESDQQQ